MALAYCFTEYGGPDTQVLLDLPVPTPGPGQLLVAVRAAGVDPADWKVRAGLRVGTVDVAFPAVLGREVSGVVVRSNELGFAEGDEVFGAVASGHGGYAQFTVLDASAAAHKPPTVSYADAATIPVAAGTAFDALDQLAVASGHTLLVIGAGGGVGVAALQLARARGIHVIGSAGDSKADTVRALGAEWIGRGHVPDRDVDAIFDLVGGDTLRAAAAHREPGCQLISVADPALAAELGGSGVTRRRTTAVFETIAALMESGVLDPRVMRRFPLERAGDALAAVEEGHADGKVVLEMA